MNPSIHKTAAAVALALCCALPAHAAPLYQASVLPDVFHATLADGSPAGIYPWAPFTYAFSVSGSGQFAGTLTSGVALAGFRYRGGAVDLLSAPGRTDSTVADINNTGTAVGSVHNVEVRGTNVNYLDEQAMVLGPTGMAYLGTLGGSGSRAAGINDAGTVVGSAQVAGDHHWEAFAWKDGTMQPLLPGGRASTAVGVNNRGDVIGTIWHDPAGLTSGEAFLYSDGQLQLLGDVLARSGTAAQYVKVINDQGAILGGGLGTSFVLRDGAVTFLAGLKDPQFGVDTPAQGDDINNLGEVVGGSLLNLYTNVPEAHATLWKDGQVLDLNALLAGGLPDGVTLTRAVGIDDRSRIWALGTDRRVYQLTLVPEPSTLALSALGLAGAAVAARRRTRAAPMP